MKKLFLFIAIAAALTTTAKAQDASSGAPKAEVFGGFSIFSAEFDDNDRNAAYGWQASVAGNPSPMLGLVADFAGQYTSISGVDVSVHEFLFGPRINTRGEKANGFLHFLLGGARFSGGGESTNGLMLGIGGGVDVRAGEHVSIRAVQFDWTPARFDGDWSGDVFRVGFGVVFGG